ncbi:MAG: AsmA family protein [Rhodospirillales bacterium]
MKHALRYALGSLLIVILGLTAAAVFVQGNHLKPFAENAISSALGRETTIGDLQLDKGWMLGITATDISVANADWAPEEPMAELDELTVRFRFMSIFDSQLDIPLIRARGGTVEITRDTDGKLNWSSASSAGDAAAPEERSEIPSIGEIEIADVTVSYQDMASQRSDKLVAASIDGVLRGKQDVFLKGNGTINSSPFSFEFAGGPFEQLVNPDGLYPVRLAVDGPSRLRIEGELATSANGRTRLTSVRLTGDDFADLGIPFGIPLPATPPYDLTGTVLFGDSQITLEGFAGRIGDSDADGNLTVDYGRELPRLTGNIHSRRLDFDDLAGLIGAAPDPDETASPEQKQQARKEGIFPETPIPVGLFRSARIDLTLVADSVISPVAQVDSIYAHVVLNDDRLIINPLKATVANGELTGEIAINVRQDIPSADIDVTLNGLEIYRFFEGSDFMREMGGAVSGRIYLLGTGMHLAEILGTAQGGGHLVLRNGRISGLIVEASGLDITESLGLLIGGDVSIEMPCAVAAVTADAGVLSIRHGVISTDDSLIITEGNVDLFGRTMDLKIEAREKDFSLIDLTAPISVRGALQDPDITIGGFDFFPFFSMPQDKTKADCNWLIEQARKAAPGIPEIQ